MRTNLKEAEPVQADELAVARADADFATERKRLADVALADARVRLEELEAKVKTAPRGEPLRAVIRDRNDARDEIEVLKVDVMEAETARIEAVEVAAKIQLERDKAAMEVTIGELQGKIATATEELAGAVKAFGDAILNRGRVLETAEQYNTQARNYGLPLAHGASTREVLEQLEVVKALKRSGVRIEVGPGPVFIA